jgi:hypothetical protein
MAPLAQSSLDLSSLDRIQTLPNDGLGAPQEPAEGPSPVPRFLFHEVRG